MSVDFIVEDGSGRGDATSYAALADADAYHAGHVAALHWARAPETARQAALVMATRLLDERMSWAGDKAVAGSALRWPRHGTLDRDGIAQGSDMVPRPVREATAELARLLLDDDRTAEAATAGLRRLTVGPLGLELDPADRRPVIPAHVRRMLDHLGRAAEGSLAVPLQRS